MKYEILINFMDTKTIDLIAYLSRVEYAETFSANMLFLHFRNIVMPKNSKINQISQIHDNCIDRLYAVPGAIKMAIYCRF